ncbi:MAG: SatD family protein [Ornithinimicrobium sp.]|jgi:hypothetical protein|uniref:SatD family protein n=1 Tax=Ornithinimicrobium sp. TaxID=1977084 RepID=UPI003D9BBFF2
MTPVSSTRATVLGDLIGSRLSADRRGLHERLTAALTHVNQEIVTDQPLAVIAGDEVQGTYAGVGDALGAVFLLRSLLSPGTDLRFGIGRGDVTVLDAETGIQDGPGWWAARQAIEEVEAGQQVTGQATWRTAYREHEPDHGTEQAVNAALVCQDLVLGSLDQTGWTIVRGMMQERTHASIAEELGISRQAVQQRRKSAGLPMLLASISALRSLP